MALVISMKLTMIKPCHLEQPTCVYAPDEQKYKECRKLYLDRRADYLALADYREGTELDKICKNILDKIASYILQPGESK